MNFLGMFILFVLAWISAIILFFQMPSFPPVWVGLLGLLLSIVLGSMIWLKPFKSRLTLGYSRLTMALYNIFLGFIIGGTWVFWQSFFQPNVAPEFLNQSVMVSGQIIELPELTNLNLNGTQKRRVRMTMALNSISTIPLNFKPDQAWSGLKPILIINWYQTQADTVAFLAPKLGETWQFKVKLSSNHAAINPAGMDYERWLFGQYVSAKGYVQGQSPKNAQSQVQDLSPINDHYAKRIDDWGVWSWRASMAEHLSMTLAHSPYQGVYKALLYGDDSAIEPSDWTLLQSTGTIHLMAISGLHMALVAFLGILLAKGLWQIWAYRWTGMDLPMLSLVFSVGFATAYLAMSGAAIPTQRAWIMVVAILGFLLLQRRFQRWQVLAMAALLVVMWDPRAVLSYGFWLSFGAVVLIFVSLTRPGQPQLDNNKAANTQMGKVLRWLSGLYGFLKIQTVLTLGLAPALIWAFSSLPIYSFLANLLAVPLVSFVGLPALFGIALLSVISVEWAQFWVAQLDVVWGGLWWFLELLAQLPHSNWRNGALSFLGMLGLYALLLLGVVLTKPALKWTALLAFVLGLGGVLSDPFVKRPHFGQAWVTVLDVGQGQAVVIETQHHVTVVDTGAKWGDTMDGAKMAILPYLRAQNWSKIDTLIISHSDLDHAGGVQTLLDSLPINQLLSGQAEVLNIKHALPKAAPMQANHAIFKPCLAHQAWSVDGVDFTMWSPFKADLESGLRSDNDLSCVLKVGQGVNSVLIPGDLSTAGEKRLLATHSVEAGTRPETAHLLHAGWLVAGHHGSKHSTSSDWLHRVNPHTVVFSAGYLNRFNFPNVQTVERIGSRNIRWFNTACSGAVRFELGALEVQESRKTQRKWYHHACLDTQKGVFFE
ncbi:DNA internalization-related competence protein ComEC/Rec2 [Thiomicrorhabdus aquaedulcis]|uniref:DNA internalization-related competence protein ComEC/Rec2 n=1 Tax=Thiomicrorhabdus aquaedulcis TaxID=2211106 RepID=UPI000FDABCCD|nr:DNA internalization-related competence protein ComEC/Rec2 [Thiomicrorhabdus aquaedulcis]